MTAASQEDTCRNLSLNRWDGLPGPNEDCDDSNQVNGDGCDNNCTVTNVGMEFVPNQRCVMMGIQMRPTTAYPTVNAHTVATASSKRVETCDDGNRQEIAQMTVNLHDRRWMSPSLQACDNGNERNDDGCLTTCVLPECGDGYVQAGDGDGNTMANDAAQSVPYLTMR